MWVLLNQDLNLYLFKEGYLRTSCYEYNVNNQYKIKDIYINLTNNAI